MDNSRNHVTIDVPDENTENFCSGKNTTSYIRLTVIFFSIIILLLFLIFVIFPIIFMYSIDLQTLFMFMNINLPNDQSYYDNYNETGYRNLYVSVKDLYTDKSISLGVWHLLPHNLTNISLTEENFDYNDALANSNYSVILYFHGTGEARSYCNNMYNVLRNHSHVIAFDYRNFADSTRANLTEDAVVNDSVELYKWLRKNTNSDIYIWGHSLGTAIASRTISILKYENIIPMGLFLESPFTSMREELPVHTYGKLFAWLPWFEATVLNPLHNNGFIFNTEEHILSVDCPIMIMHAEDDSVVPYTLGKKLYHIALDKRLPAQGKIIYYQFSSKLNYDHFRIYKEPNLSKYIEDFMNISISYKNKTSL